MNLVNRLKLTQNAQRPFLNVARTGQIWRYADIDALSQRYAGVLKRAGLSKGERILVQVEKSPEAVALYLAALRLGAIYAPLNTAYTDEELNYFIADAAPRIVVRDPERCADPGRVADAPGPAILTLGADGSGALQAAASTGAPYAQTVACEDDDLASLIYTSGTTGRAKGAMLSHANLRVNAEALAAAWGFTGDDILLHALPLFHVHGLFIALNTAMIVGCEVLFERAFDPAEVRRLAPRASVLMGVPTYFSRLLAMPDFGASDVSHLRLVVSGSAPLPPTLHAAFQTRTGIAILERYGMSEAGVIASNPLDGARVAGTVGFALPGVDLRLAAPDGTSAPDEIEIRGTSVFKGYWQMPDKTAEAFTEDGWFRTGDIGAMDPEGRLTIVGRAKDLIIVGGFNVYPREIEVLLDSLPGVAESAVIGVSHPDMGEGVVAVLTPVADRSVELAELEAAVARLAKFKRPRRFFLIDAMPRNAMGKVMKNELRRRFADAFKGS